MPSVPKGNLRAHTASRVRAARAWANLSQPELARTLDISLSGLRRIEQESRDVTTPELLQIGEVCGVPRRFMLFGWSEPGKANAQTQAEALEGILADITSRVERHERLYTEIRDHLRLNAEGEPESEAVDMDKPPAVDPDLMAKLESSLQASRKANRKPKRNSASAKG